ncbi:MAG TPA: SUF system NifU family Fe-S cluster assembly protein [Nitrospinaceae bacterium]|jgi:nitrogen fixation NifU-like protein|nr:SUF system NifU family Fe-S cluster assembly protein [Nitrospinaceae bacterium]HIB42613.1 SUF system NifU family Fe-S cluster assembly protein [Nitrospina sp.]HIN87167.1 SUF system NifU family Fe-S cluster assembly protein [Nitrospinaceae bacterium]HIO23389.1 SUF system NifU family Fe-S cluster assembly protein [Nitrospinaceae bacterium]|tara:strand:- start:6411 stop:6869 length:459 start_codon:yes stop_codon:yes gene_type:complete
MSYDNELYQQVILDHNRKPRNFHEMENPTNICHGINPLCGDDITVYLEVDEAGGVIKNISFTGSGCAISKASTSLMTQFLKGKKIDESRLIFDEFHKMVLGEFDPEKQEHHLGKLTLFMGIREYPSRTKCASLAWHTMVGALDKKAEGVSTE